MASIQFLIPSRIFTYRLTSAFPHPNLLPSPSNLSLRMNATAAESSAAQEAGAETVSHTTNVEVNSSSSNSEADPLIQYVVLRRDLIDSWPLGSIVSQGCHASVAAICTFKDDPHTLHYCDPSNLDFMRKVTVEVKGEAQMLNLSEKLNSSGIAHKLWIEQPENIPTCIATKPYPKSIVSSLFKRLKLCK